MSKTLVLGTIAAGVGLFTLAGFLLWQNVSNQVTHTPAPPPPAPAPIPPSSPQPQTPTTEGWQTYRSDEFGFEVEYLSDWRATTRGFGEFVSATGRESSVFLGDNPGIRGVSIRVATLGSEKLGTAYSSAKNVKEYTDLLTKTDPSGTVIRRFIQKRDIGDVEALEFERFNWDVDSQQQKWNAEFFLQKDNDIYTFAVRGNVQENVVDQLLATFRFVE